MCGLDRYVRDPLIIAFLSKLNQAASAQTRILIYAAMRPGKHTAEKIIHIFRDKNHVSLLLAPVC